MYVYLAGVDETKGVPASHYVIVNPGNHEGIAAVPAAWTEKAPNGDVQGKTFPVHFVNGRACPEDALGEYLVKYGHAQKLPWKPKRAPWDYDE
jgi:hypothetical protein